ncbi:MAG: LuxR C-terminal-related transcriptional regulator [Gloeotrichia echinulata DEX184]|nr:LuxR C-terminal-related transcriptional regulator [Gloeotrichia echinulata DEX184]
MSEEYYELSPREAEVFDLLLQGMSNKEISEELVMHPNRTVANHVADPSSAKTGRKTRQKLAAQVKRESIKVVPRQANAIYILRKKRLSQ